MTKASYHNLVIFFAQSPTMGKMNVSLLPFYSGGRKGSRVDYCGVLRLKNCNVGCKNLSGSIQMVEFYVFFSFFRHVCSTKPRKYIRLKEGLPIWAKFAESDHRTVKYICDMSLTENHHLHSQGCLLNWVHCQRNKRKHSY